MCSSNSYGYGNNGESLSLQIIHECRFGATEINCLGRTTTAKGVKTEKERITIFLKEQLIIRKGSTADFRITGETISQDFQNHSVICSKKTKMR